MAYHNSTCGCAECGNYGQVYNPRAIHNQSCGCAECGNYPTTRVRSEVVLSAKSVVSDAAPNTVPDEVEMIAVPVELLDEVRALIARQRNA